MKKNLLLIMLFSLFVGSVSAYAGMVVSYDAVKIGNDLPNNMTWQVTVNAIDDDGTVGGEAFDGNDYIPFIWKNGVTRLLDTVGGCLDRIKAVRGGRMIMGTYHGNSSGCHQNDVYAYLSPDNVVTYQEIDSDFGTKSDARGVNDQGIVGCTIYNPDVFPVMEATFWKFNENGGMTKINLGTLGGMHSCATEIDSGYVTGNAYISSGQSHTFLLNTSNLVMQDLGGGSNSSGYDIVFSDTLGPLVFGHSTTIGGTNHATIWTNQEMFDLQSKMINANWSKALGGNSYGDAVGIFVDSSSPFIQAFHYTKNNIVNLNNYIDPNSGIVRIEEAVGINNNGWIIANVVFSDHRGSILLKRVERVQGDLDGDKDVDKFDFYKFIASLGSCRGMKRYNQAVDYDKDGCVTFKDYKIWYSYYKDFINS